RQSSRPRLRRKPRHPWRFLFMPPLLLQPVPRRSPLRQHTRLINREHGLPRRPRWMNHIWDNYEEAPPHQNGGHIRPLARPMTPAGDHMAVFDHCMTSVSETRGCGLETCGLGLKSCSPGLESRSPGLKSSGPDLKSCSPGSESLGLGLETCGPGLKSSGPNLETRDLGSESRDDIAI